MKAKTRSFLKKRVRITGSGKIKVMKAARKHLLQQKSKKQKRLGKAGKSLMVNPTRLRDVRRALPYL